jgi:hypothetical protein
LEQQALVDQVVVEQVVDLPQLEMELLIQVVVEVVVEPVLLEEQEDLVLLL